MNNFSGKTMIRRFITIFSIILLSLCANQLLAQGLRSTGLGFRISYWNMHDASDGFRVSTGGLNQSVNIEGFGFWLNFSWSGRICSTLTCPTNPRFSSMYQLL